MTKDYTRLGLAVLFLVITAQSAWAISPPKNVQVSDMIFAGKNAQGRPREAFTVHWDYATEKDNNILDYQVDPGISSCTADDINGEYVIKKRWTIKDKGSSVTFFCACGFAAYARVRSGGDADGGTWILATPWPAKPPASCK
jgi:hypothetical protein